MRLNNGSRIGERHGHYRHGRRTKDLVAEHREGRTLLREMLRLLAEPEGHDGD